MHAVGRTIGHVHSTVPRNRSPLPPSHSPNPLFLNSRPSVCPCVLLFASISPLSLFPLIRPSIRLSVCLSVCLSLCLTLSLSVCLSVCPVSSCLCPPKLDLEQEQEQEVIGASPNHGHRPIHHHPLQGRLTFRLCIARSRRLLQNRAAFNFWSHCLLSRWSQSLLPTLTYCRGRLCRLEPDCLLGSC